MFEVVSLINVIPFAVIVIHSCQVIRKIVVVEMAMGINELVIIPLTQIMGN